MIRNGKADLKALKGEKWKELNIKSGKYQKHYSISDLGRIASFTTKLDQDFAQTSPDSSLIIEPPVNPNEDR